MNTPVTINYENFITRKDMLIDFSYEDYLIIDSSEASYYNYYELEILYNEYIKLIMNNYNVIEVIGIFEDGQSDLIEFYKAATSKYIQDLTDYYLAVVNDSDKEAIENKFLLIMNELNNFEFNLYYEGLSPLASMVEDYVEGLNRISIDDIKKNRYVIKKNTNDNALLLYHMSFYLTFVMFLKKKIINILYYIVKVKY